MTLLTPENPVFPVCLMASAVQVLKIMAQGGMTVFRMLNSNLGMASLEDIQVDLVNKSPSLKQREVNDCVERARRMHRNDLENIPAFWTVRLLFVAVDLALWVARFVMHGFVLAGLAHFGANSTMQMHEVQAGSYTIGSVIVIYMAQYVLWFAVL